VAATVNIREKNGAEEFTPSQNSPENLSSGTDSLETQEAAAG